MDFAVASFGNPAYSRFAPFTFTPVRGWGAAFIYAYNLTGDRWADDQGAIKTETPKCQNTETLKRGGVKTWKGQKVEIGCRVGVIRELRVSTARGKRWSIRAAIARERPGTPKSGGIGACISPASDVQWAFALFDRRNGFRRTPLGGAL